MLNSNRMQAIYRLLGLVWLALVTPILLAVGAVAGFIFMVVDVLWQLLTGNQGLMASSGSGASSWLVRLYEWPLAQAEYIFLGKDSWMWLP